MKILSIDCGIKNLAICFLSIDSLSKKELKIVQNKIEEVVKLDKQKIYTKEINEMYNKCIHKNFKIHFWDNINMFPLDSRFDNMKCHSKGCTHNVKFHKNYQIGFCTRHSKKPIVSDPKTIVSGLKEIKERNAKLISYFDIAMAIKNNLDKLNFEGLDKIFIEQQPQKNGRMKHFQMMIFQYLVMRYSNTPNLTIHFVSPKHKLKGPDCGAFYKASVKKNKYAQNKEVSVKQTHKILSENPDNKKWYKFLCSVKSKQDDYCDCFLQAYMFYDFIK